MADIARIKGNIGKMISQNAPEADIDAYLAGEGVSLDELKGNKSTPPDKYQQAAIDERNTAFPKQRGLSDLVTGAEGSAPTGDAGFTRRLAHGFTLGADSTILAGLQTPLEMIKHGTFDPREGYNYAKAREDYILDQSRKNTGALGTAVEALGGAVSAGGLAKGGATTAALLPETAGPVARTLAGAADAAGIGGFSGAMEGNGLEERARNAATGALVGFGVGATLPGVLAAAKFLATPITSQIAARMNPKAYAEAQVARAISEGKMTPHDVEIALQHADTEGQGVFTVADALGNPGQRLLSTVARSPGEGRTAVVEAMDSRQGDQGRRLTGALREGFDAPQTAEQTRQAMVQQAGDEARINYAPVKAETQPIDVSQPVALANRSISPAADTLAMAQGAVPTDIAARSGIERSESAIRDPIGRAVSEARSYLASPTLTSSNVGKAFRAKTNIDQMIAKATDNKQGALVGELMPIRDALDEQLARSSPNYAKARDAYRVRQQQIGALDKGKEFGSRQGNPEDAIDHFNSLTPAQQQAFRAGYADPQISQVKNAAWGTNKARPLTSDAIRQEFGAFAASPGRAGTLQRQIGRENTMFQTRNQALGGSRTVENLNDDAAMGVAPEVMGVIKNVMTGNFGGAVKTALSAGQNALTGNTPAVRSEVAKVLLQNGRNISAGRLEAMVDAIVNRAMRASQIADGIRKGVIGGSAVAGPGDYRNRNLPAVR